MEKGSEMTKEQKVKFFKNEILRFVKYFGLLDYEIFFNEQDNENNFATSYFWYYDSENGDAQNVEIKYSKSWINKKLTKKEISKIAFHETMEILLFRLYSLARSRDIVVTNKQVDIENHRIIRILENTIFEKLI